MVDLSSSRTVNVDPAGYMYHGCIRTMVVYVYPPLNMISFTGKTDQLVGGFKHGDIIFHVISMGCHPKPIDFHSMIFQDGYCTTNQINHWILRCQICSDKPIWTIDPIVGLDINLTNYLYTVWEPFLARYKWDSSLV